jgi:hypothetical protein
LLTKNISIDIKKGEKVPLKETYLVFYKFKNKVKLVQKFIDDKNNQSIILNFEECQRLINLFDFYLFDSKFSSFKDKMLVFDKD